MTAHNAMPDILKWSDFTHAGLTCKGCGRAYHLTTQMTVRDRDMAALMRQAAESDGWLAVRIGAVSDEYEAWCPRCEQRCQPTAAIVEARRKRGGAGIDVVDRSGWKP